MKKASIFTSTAIMGSMLVFAPAAIAAAETAQFNQIGDIVVTARKTEESLQTTPVAVTALGEQSLVDTGVEDVTDLQQSVPSLVVARGSAGSSNFAFVAIRGQGNLQPILANDPAVATYIDGVYIARPSAGQSDLQDIQRLEVLRGPQGTLFGRNTTGGAINIITKDPEYSFGGHIKGEVGNLAQKKFEASLNVPLSENLAALVNYSFRNSDGIGQNTFLGRNAADTKSHFARGKIKYEGNGFNITFSGDYNKMSDHGQLTQLSTINPDFATFGVFPASFTNALASGLHTREAWWDTYAGGITTPAGGTDIYAADAQAYYARPLPFNELEAYGFAATIDVELGNMNLKSISAYRSTEDFGLSDTDGSPAPLLATFAGSKSDYISQEVQLSGDLTDKLSFITGAYYGKEEGIEFSRSQIFGGALRDSNADITNKTFGVFAQAYYDISDTLRAVGGFRYTWDKRDSVLHNQQVFGLDADAPVAGTPFGINCTVTTPDSPVTADNCNQTQNAKFDYPAWTAGLDWQASDDLFVYLKTSGAAKAGGWNLRAGGLPAFAPEKVKDVEIGFKADLLDNRVRLNAAAFHLWKTGNQAIVNSFVPGIGVTQYIQNNGDARIYGLEAELTVIPWEGMEIGANMSLMKGKYKDGSFTETQVLSDADFANCSTPNGDVANGCVVDLSNQKLYQLPSRQFNISASQSVPINENATFKLFGNWAYVSAQTFAEVTLAPENTSEAAIRQANVQNALGRIPGYGTFNTRASITLEEPNIELAAFVRNIGNKKYIVRSFADLYQTLGIAAEYAGAPRTWGMSIGYKF